jgi:hypothetical protein
MADANLLCAFAQRQSGQPVRFQKSTGYIKESLLEIAVMIFAFCCHWFPSTDVLTVNFRLTARKGTPTQYFQCKYLWSAKG